MKVLRCRYYCMFVWLMLCNCSGQADGRPDSRAAVTDTSASTVKTAERAEDFRIYFKNDTIRVVSVSSGIVYNIPYRSPEENPVPCQGLAVYGKSGKARLRSWVMLNDSLLMVPARDHNRVINVFILDLRSRLTLEYQKWNGRMFSTALPWVVADIAKNEFILTNSFDLENKTTVHVFGVGTQGIVHKTTYPDQATGDVRQNEEDAVAYIEKLVKRNREPER